VVKGLALRLAVESSRIGLERSVGSIQILKQSAAHRIRLILVHIADVPVSVGHCNHLSASTSLFSMLWVQIFLHTFACARRSMCKVQTHML